MGTVLPGTVYVTGTDCTLVFGSSNDTAQLRLAQADGSGVAMFQETRGALDGGFDGDGLQTTAVGAAAALDQSRAMVTQADGKIVAVGECGMGGATGGDVCLARYTTAGALDTTFDTDGKVTTSVSPGVATDYGLAAALQVDGRIVVAGSCNMGGATGWDFCLERYNTDGSLDTSFDTDGIVTTTIAPGAANDDARGVVIQPDGKIVAAGFCVMGGATGTDFCLARYTANGSLDTSFDTDGIVTTPIAPGAGADNARSIALSGSNLIVAGFCAMGGATGTDICLADYTSSGALDTTFSGDGLQTTAVGPGANTDDAESVVVQADGKPVAFGFCNMGATGEDLCATRYTTVGALDTTFSGDGIQTTAVGAAAAAQDEGYDVAIQPDGNIIGAGSCDVGGASAVDLCLVRYRTDGSLDTTFNTTGTRTIAVGGGTNSDVARAIESQPDGNVAATGVCDFAATGSDICVARLVSGGTIQQYSNGSTDFDQGSSMFGACLSTYVAPATNVWTANAGCPASDGAWWNAVPTGATIFAHTTVASGTGAIARLRFGLRTATSQAPGAYVAPITFDVIAP